MCPVCANTNNLAQIDSKDRLYSKTTFEQETQVKQTFMLLISLLKKLWSGQLKRFAKGHAPGLRKSYVWGRAVNRKLLSHSSVHSPPLSAFTTVHPSFSEDYHVGAYYSKLLTSLTSSFSNKWRSGSWQKVIIALGSKDCNCSCHALYCTFYL